MRSHVRVLKAKFTVVALSLYSDSVDRLMSALTKRKDVALSTDL